MNKTIMILGASILQLPAIETAKEKGLNVIAVDMNPQAVGFNVEGVKKEIISTIDIPGVLEAAKKNHIDGIMTLASDMPMQTVAVVCREMGLTGISEDTALKATNKAVMRDALKDAGVPVPLYFRVDKKDSLIEAVKTIRSFGHNCIVKPADNSGSRGVVLVNDNTDCDTVFDYSAQYSRSGELVVEEYMVGHEVSVETLAVDGNISVIQITDKLTTGAPFFVEMGHSQPSQLSEKDKEEIVEVTVAANKAIGIENGPSHTEIIVTNDGPKIVEIGARLGGDCITSHLVPLSTGINLVDCCIQIALGYKPRVIPLYDKGAAIRYLKSDCGIIEAIHGIDLVSNTPGVIQLSIVHGIGEYVDIIKNSTDRVGFVVTQADCVEKAISIADRCVDSISFVLKQ